MADFEQEFLKDVKERFARHIETNPEYIVQQMSRDDDVVKLWRCGRPGLSVCAFYICSAPHCLMVYGDMGEFMWERLPDMIPFIRSSVHSLNYFSEKVPRDIKIKEDCNELVEEWFRDIKQEHAEAGREWGDEEDEALEEIREHWGYFGDVNLFKSQLFDSKLYTDCDDMPNTEFYTFHYLWIIEGLKWFIQQLDGGHVLPYCEPAEVTS